MNPRVKHRAWPPCLLRIGDGACTGCGACANACPADALAMACNREGFYRPALDPARCNACDRCLSACPVLAVRPAAPAEAMSPEVFAAWSTDEAVHRSSSSGGVFSELARHVLGQGGAVCGCEWGPGWVPRHVIVRDWEGVARLRQSKYLPSRVDPRFYREVLRLAREGTPVLFCGTPCQVAGLARLAPSEARANLLLADLVCHGVPSLRSFQLYLDWKFGGAGQMVDFSFRNKEVSIQTIRAETRRGVYLAAVGCDDWFRSSFVNHLFLQRACFACRFCIRPRHGDLTLGDFWGIPEGWHDRRGDSVAVANTASGRAAMAGMIADGKLRVRPSDWATATCRSSRLRGEDWRVPVLRALALALVARGAGFGWIRRWCLSPFDLLDQTAYYARRLRDRLSRRGAG